MNFGERLRHARMMHGVTQTELAAMTGIKVAICNLSV